jgi:hypothetical protein
MEVFAWTGLGIIALLLLVSLVVWIVGMLSNPFGRAILLGWALLAAAAWAVTGGLYLLWTHGG